jgi:hypothetical protein
MGKLKSKERQMTGPIIPKSKNISAENILNKQIPGLINSGMDPLKYNAHIDLKEYYKFQLSDDIKENLKKKFLKLFNDRVNRQKLKSENIKKKYDEKKHAKKEKAKGRRDRLNKFIVIDKELTKKHNSDLSKAYEGSYSLEKISRIKKKERDNFNEKMEKLEAILKKSGYVSPDHYINYGVKDLIY